jgi:integrase
MRPQAHSQTQPANRVDQPLPRFIAKTRYTYASLCVAAGIPPREISRFMGHAKITTTLTIYSRLFPFDHTEHMTALAAMNAPVAANVVPMHRRG